jgi:hypothetical protein
LLISAIHLAAFRQSDFLNCPLPQRCLLKQVLYLPIRDLPKILIPLPDGQERLRLGEAYQSLAVNRVTLICDCNHGDASHREFRHQRGYYARAAPAVVMTPRARLSKRLTVPRQQTAKRTLARRFADHKTEKPDYGAFMDEGIAGVRSRRLGWWGSTGRAIHLLHNAIASRAIWLK